MKMFFQKYAWQTQEVFLSGKFFFYSIKTFKQRFNCSIAVRERKLSLKLCKKVYLTSCSFRGFELTCSSFNLQEFLIEACLKLFPNCRAKLELCFSNPPGAEEREKFD